MAKSEVKVFKVGDKVVGIQFNGYNGTNEKCLLEVVAFNEESGTFDGKCLAHKTLKEMAGQTFRNLRSGGFELATPEKENEILLLGLGQKEEELAKQYESLNTSIGYICTSLFIPSEKSKPSNSPEVSDILTKAKGFPFLLIFR